MRTMVGLIFSFLILLAGNHPALAKMYKWYDREGQVHVSDRFPDQARQKGGVFRLEEVDTSESFEALPPSDLAILTSRAYRSDGQVVVVGEVQNNTASREGDIRLQVVAYDLLNKLFNAVWASPEPSTLEVGRAGIFKTYLDDPYKVITRVEIRLMDAAGGLRGTTATVYVTEPRSLPEKSPALTAASRNIYTPVQELPVSAIPYTSAPYTSAPSVAPPTPYSSNLTVGYSGYLINPIIGGYVPYSYKLPGPVIYNKTVKNVFICNSCVAHPKVPFRFEPPVRFEPRFLPEPRRVFTEPGRATLPSETYWRNR